MRLVNRLFFLFAAVAGYATMAQERCGVVEYTNEMKRQKRIPADDRIFEDWLKQKMQLQRTSRDQRQKSGPYRVPVVVHIIHNGEPVGTGTNISDAQILSQIDVLNKDYKRLNADASKTPSEFVGVAGSMDIEFVLAKQDPEGLPSTGITRKQGTKTGWTNNDSYELKSLDYWPAEDYVNIWVCDLIDDLVGSAQLPESTLPGLENSSTNRLTDGLIIWYRAFGSIDDGPFDLATTYNRGRTLTHEMGHYFGLRHIWGDDGAACTGDDYVSDTPNQAGSSSGCPTHPKTTCSTVNMFQNYMDYTADVCMNLFTQGQVARMNIVIENSPRRASLLTSHGLVNPGEAAIDLGIRNIIKPLDTECESVIVPTIEVRNYGSDVITSAKIVLTLNGAVDQTLTFPLNLTNLQSTMVEFNPVPMVQGSNTISFEIVQVNSTNDQNGTNNSATKTAYLPQTISTPFTETFNVMPSGWTIENPDGLVTWALTTAPKESSTNKAIAMKLFEYEESYGEIDILKSPIIDLSNVPVAALVFDVAYSRYLSSNDVLKVVAIRNCEPFENGVVIFQKSGSDLRTVNSFSDEFVPSGTSDWRREFKNISQLIGEAHLQLAFVCTSDWGNNLYVDNISILTSELEDVSLLAMTSPGLVTCVSNPPVILHAQNEGTKNINSLTVQYQINQGTVQSAAVTGLDIALGEEFDIDLGELNLAEGTNVIHFELLNPNGMADQTPATNSGDFTVIVDQKQNKIPLRENFDNGLGDWITVNPTGGMNWETTETNFGTSLFFNAHNNSVIGDAAWLISPVLDFSAATTASVVIDVASATRLDRHETLSVLTSTDCGNTFRKVAQVALDPIDQETAFAPTNEAQWQQDVEVILNRAAGQQNVRIAFVVTNENGNNLFLDNLEFFETDNPNLIKIDDDFAIYGYNLETPKDSYLQITFKLNERQDVPFSIVDMMGKIHAEGTLRDVLNQTYPLTTSDLSQGVYLVRLKIDGSYRSSRILITH